MASRSKSNGQVPITKSLRQQIKAVCELDRSETRSEVDLNAVVYFPDELRYSTIKMRQLDDPNSRTGDVVKVKSGGKFYTGTLLNIGSEANCTEVQVGLEAAMKMASKISRQSTNNQLSEEEEEVDDPDYDGKNDSDGDSSSHSSVKEAAIISTIANEKQKLAAIIANLNSTAPASKSATMKASAGLAKDDGAVVHELQEIKGLLNDIKGLMSKNNQLLEQLVSNGTGSVQPAGSTVSSTPISSTSRRVSSPIPSTSRASSSPFSSPVPSKKRKAVFQPHDHEDCLTTDDRTSETKSDELVYKGMNLLDDVFAPPKDPTLYGTKLLGVLYTTEELENGIVEASARSSRSELDPVRMALLKSCISTKYGSKTFAKCWLGVRNSLNQKCRDIKRKLTTKPTVPALAPAP